ncbi:MAG: hypothetical protein H7843_12870 [Nitrospirota bacterium]
MEFFLNELSLDGQFNNLNDFYAATDEVLECRSLIKKYGYILYCKGILSSKHVCRDTMFQTAIKNYADRNKKNLILAWITKDGPFWELQPTQTDFDTFSIENSSATDITDIIDTSLVEAAKRKYSQIDCQTISYRYSKYTYTPISIIMERHSDGSTETVEFRNYWQLSALKNYFAEYIKEGITSWDTFWGNRESLFPQLVFCTRVKSQLDDKIINFKSYYPRVCRHLQCMNNYIGKVRDKLVAVPDYETMGIDATPEYKETLGSYGKERTFACPDGKKRLFKWHSKMKGSNKRIHFYPPDSTTNMFYIGHIGEHLTI